MITKLQCVNITSKDTKALADFYRTIGAPVFVENEDYDGWNLVPPKTAVVFASGTKTVRIYHHCFECG